MLENKVVKNEQLKSKLEAILKKFSESGDLLDKGLMSREQVGALKEFGDIYGQIADDMLKDSKKVKNTFIEAQRGASDSFKTSVKEAKGT